jgi:hypothetical protein
VLDLLHAMLRSIFCRPPLQENEASTTPRDCGFITSSSRQPHLQVRSSLEEAGS